MYVCELEDEQPICSGVHSASLHSVSYLAQNLVLVFALPVSLF